jgi:hypothetical protein
MYKHVIIDKKVRLILVMFLLVIVFTIALYKSETTINTVGYTIRWLAQ